MILDSIVGIDEAGRGPIAGPVAVGAVSVRDDKVREFFDGFPLRDSKTLSERQREKVFTRIEEAVREGLLTYTVTFTEARAIDLAGIVLSIEHALGRALEMLSVHRETTILLDGGLSAPKRYTNQKSIIRGDSSECAIMLAAITAKVLRDRRMRGLHEKYPEYGFGKHKGYGTRAHYQALEQNGLCPEHRKSFLRNLETPTKSCRGLTLGSSQG